MQVLKYIALMSNVRIPLFNIKLVNDDERVWDFNLGLYKHKGLIRWSLAWKGFIKADALQTFNDSFLSKRETV